jgi:serine protease Do
MMALTIRFKPRHALLLALVLAVPLACDSSRSNAATAGYAALVRRAAPSVVTVLVEEQDVSARERAAQQASAQTEDTVATILRRLLSGPGGGDHGEGPSAALGSGFIIRADGLIVTNRHVIVGARTVRVRLADGREVRAQIVGSDAVTDIALLRVDAGRLPALRLGSSTGVAVGDAVVAIGNPFGLGQSVSAGIVSARARTLEDDPYVDFLQTDAAINRGNSGGPLLSVDGTVVGVTSAILSPSGGSVGLGFAIPAETVAAVVGDLERHGRVERGFFGITIQGLTPALARALKLPKAAGALVAAVDPQGPAAGSLEIGDVLVRIGSAPADLQDLNKLITRLVPDSLVPINLIRGGAQETVALKVGRLPDPPADPALSGGEDTWVPALGIGVAETTVAIRKAIKAPDEAGGLIVTRVLPARPGALAGLQVGDLITHAGTQSATVAADVTALAKPTAMDPVLLRVVRAGSAAYVAITGEAEN